MSEFNFNHPIPLLFLGDACDSLTGLGRIGHDLAWLASSLPEFKVGYLGRQGVGRSRFPWHQYSFSEHQGWGEGLLEPVWNDLAGNDHGIIMTLWDASRLLWFADGKDSFLQSGRFERWAYIMADASGPDGRFLPQAQAHVISQYQRVLIASQWGLQLASGPPHPDLDWMPHPINRNVFKPVSRMYGRSAWGVSDQDPIIGCVMTNQARKHWPTVFETIAVLSQMTYSKPRLWMHTDLLFHYWDLQALAVEYGIGGQIICENRPLSDAELAMRYSACDVTLVVSGGEGFCYPVAESLSCGVPVVTGGYGAQAELTNWTVAPVASYIDTIHNVRRAIYSANDIADTLLQLLLKRPLIAECEGLVSHLNMARLGILWKRWLKQGLK